MIPDIRYTVEPNPNGLFFKWRWYVEFLDTRYILDRGHMTPEEKKARGEWHGIYGGMSYRALGGRTLTQGAALRKGLTAAVKYRTGLLLDEAEALRVSTDRKVVVL